MEVGLVQGHAVDLERRSGDAPHGVASYRDHPLDQVVLVCRGHQADDAERLLHPVQNTVVVRVRPVSQPPGSRKTTTSPRRGVVPNHGVSLSTRTRSPFCRVFCIDAEGIEKACTKNVLIPTDRTSAAPTRTANSRHHGRWERPARRGSRRSGAQAPSSRTRRALAA